ncbi:unnamed protein product [Acanthoscelides obtectus]|uniref:Chitin-binding type-2 domain-containing protein n=1 Tax=Acanthoscelides obtectus TaxID=200917 RepID=A0A9P0K3Y5_ACAOB|nr:unnamed protein product [Acanthoscelides obtectus]CAK1667383.1 hypothetical protein AOBTE_LOCUS25813 [Acanthoscelides obtectus]
MYPSSKISTTEMTLRVIASIFGLFLLIQTSAGLAPPPVCKENGVYGDANDCTKFYMCSPCGPLEFYCPTGNYFDPEKKACTQDENQKCESSSILPSSQEVITPDVDITFLPNNFSCMIMVVDDDYDVGMEDESAEYADVYSSDLPENPAQSKEKNETDSSSSTGTPKETIYDNNSKSREFSVNTSAEILEIDTNKSAALNNTASVPHHESQNYVNISKEYSEVNTTNSTLDEEILLGDRTQNITENITLSKEDKQHIISNNTADIYISHELKNITNAEEVNTIITTKSITNVKIAEEKHNISLTNADSEDQTDRTNFTDLSKHFDFATNSGTVNVSVDDKVNVTKDIDTNGANTAFINSTTFGEEIENFTIVHDTSDETTNVEDSGSDNSTETIQFDIIKEITIINATSSGDNSHPNTSIGLAKVAGTILEEEDAKGEIKIKTNLTDKSELSKISGHSIDNITGDHLHIDISVEIAKNHTVIADEDSKSHQELLDKVLKEIDIADDMLSDDKNATIIYTTSFDSVNATHNTVHTMTSPLPSFSAPPDVSDFVRELLGDMKDYQKIMNSVKDDLNGMEHLILPRNNTDNSTNSIDVDDVVADYLYSSSDTQYYSKILAYAIIFSGLYNVIAY